MDPETCRDYLARLGVAAPPPPTLATLALLQERHNATFPVPELSWRDAVRLAVVCPDS